LLVSITVLVTFVYSTSSNCRCR